MVIDMIRFFEILDGFLYKFQSLLVFVSMMLIILIMLAIIASRYFFNFSMSGGLELLTILGIVVYMLGGVSSSRDRNHLSVDFLDQFVKKPFLMKIHSFFVALCSLFASAFFVVIAYYLAIRGLSFPQKTNILSIPLMVPQGIMIIASVLCFLYALRDFSIVFLRLVYKERLQWKGC